MGLVEGVPPQESPPCDSWQRRGRRRLCGHGLLHGLRQARQGMSSEDSGGRPQHCIGTSLRKDHECSWVVGMADPLVVIRLMRMGVDLDPAIPSLVGCETAVTVLCIVTVSAV